MAKAPLFMSYSGLRPYKPRQRPGGQAPREAQRQRQHEVGMAREARAGDLTARREAWVQRQREQYISSGVNITPELEAKLRKAGGLGGVAPGGPRTYLGKPMVGEPAGMKDWRERREPGRDPAMFPRTRPPGGVTTGPQQFGQYSTGRPMPGKVTGREQTIHGDLPKNYYERQSEMSRRGMVLVNGRWMTREMRDELSRHKWGEATQERIDRIEGGEDRSFFRTTTPQGESIQLSGAEMRAVTALAESAKRGTAPEGLQLTPEQITNIRRYHEVVERGGEAARVDQAEAEYERQLDRLGEWQDVAGPLQRELGSEYGAMEPGSGRAGDLGVSGEQLDRLQLTDEQLDSPTMRDYRGRVAGMGGIREQLMERATGALGEVDAARAATETPRAEFRERLALLPEGAPTPEGAAPAAAPATRAPARVGDDWDWGPEGRPDQAGIIRGYIDSGIDPRKYGFTDQQIAAAQGGPAADMNRRLGAGAGVGVGVGAGASRQMPLGAGTTPRSQVDARLEPRQKGPQVPVGPFTEAPQAPLARSPRPDWLSPTDDQMVDEKAWLKRIEPYTQPAGGEGLPGIPKEIDYGKLALKDQYGEGKARDAVTGNPQISQYLLGQGDIAGAVNALKSLASQTVTPSVLTKILYSLAETNPEIADQVRSLIPHIGKLTPGAPAPGVAPGQPGGQEMGMGEIATGIVGQVKGGGWSFPAQYSEPIIAAVTNPESKLGFEVASLINAAKANPTPAAKKHIIDTVYNMIYSAVLEDMKTKPMRMPYVGGIPPLPMKWLPGGKKIDLSYQESGARDVAGRVNVVLDKMIHKQLGV